MILSDGSCKKDMVRNKRINKRKLPQLSSLGMTIYFSHFNSQDTPQPTHIFYTFVENKFSKKVAKSFLMHET